jgi:CcmD family protein
MIYLAVAFILVWLVVTLYLVYMSQRQRQLEQELHSLEEIMGQRRK